MSRRLKHVVVRVVCGVVCAGGLVLTGCSSDDPQLKPVRDVEKKDKDSVPTSSPLQTQRVTDFRATTLPGNGDPGEGADAGGGTPKIVDLRLSPARFTAGVDIVLEAVTSALEGQSVELRYTWFINDEPFVFSTGDTLPGDAFARGDRIAVEVLPVVDGEEGYVFRSDDIVVPNAVPQITSDPSSGTIANETYSFKVAAEDADGDVLSYALQEAPSGMAVDNSSGVVVWDIRSVEPGTYHFTIAADDSHGGIATQRVQISLEISQEGGR